MSSPAGHTRIYWDVTKMVSEPTVLGYVIAVWGFDVLHATYVRDTRM